MIEDKLVLENKKFNKASDGVFEWKYEFSTHPENKFPNFEIDLWYNPVYNSPSNSEYYMIGRIRWGMKEKRYGFSTYKNTFKYILEEMKQDIQKWFEGKKLFHHQVLIDEKREELQKYK